MQNRVFDTADVLIHRHPVIRARSHHMLGIGGIAIAHEIPRTVDERIHRIGFAAGGFAALGAGYARVETFVLVQRVAGTIGHAILRQDHGQIFFRHGNGSAAIAMNNRNRRAPITLAANAPVAQTPRRFLLAQPFGFQRGGNGIDRSGVVQTVECARIHGDAALFIGVPFLPLIGIVG